MRRSASFVKFGIFAVVMAVLTAMLFFTFGQYRTGSTRGFTAVFADASGVKPGDSVRVSGIRVGTVNRVSLQPDKTVVVGFDADQSVALTEGTKAAVRYLNLVGDRYLELTDGPGQTRMLPRGAQIPIDHTSAALDLDLLLGGLKPVIRGLNPQDINALTASLIQVFQGQGGTLESILSHTSSFTTAIGERHDAVEALIEQLDNVAATLSKQGDQFSGAVDKLQKLVSGLSSDRDPVGAAIDALDAGTASVADLLTQGRPPLKDTVDQLNRLAPLLDDHKAYVDTALQKAPENYRKLVRLGAYGSFVNYYLCGLSVRATDLQGRTTVFPWIKQTTGRCADS
jgi:phospholipid/cholesterol/gamma-HCH transport system substrate-binding protein